jgi:hypothetical protein
MRTEAAVSRERRLRGRRNVQALGEIVAILGERQREVVDRLEQVCRDVDMRSSAPLELEDRVTRVEARLARINEVVRRWRVVQSSVVPEARTERLGSALMYAGGLLLLWVVLWRLALAFGFS